MNNEILLELASKWERCGNEPNTLAENIKDGGLYLARVEAKKTQLYKCAETLRRNAVNPPAERIYYAYIQSQLECTD